MITAKPYILAIQMLASPFHYHFMQNAIIAGTIVAVIAGIVGYFMVIRNQSFAGHSLANVGFAGATGAALFGVSPLIGLFISGTLAAAGIHLLGAGTRQTGRSDIATGAVFTASLAVGFLFVYLSESQSTSIYDILFGNVLGISDPDVLAIVISGVVAFVIMVLFSRPLLFASVDPTVAAARGVPVRLLDFGFLIVLSLVVSMAIQVVGVLLIFALLVTPAAIAKRLSPNPPVAAFLSVCMAVIFTWTGLAAGYYTPFPVSFYITSFAFIAYIAVRIGEYIALRRAHVSV